MESLNWITKIDDLLVFPEVLSRPSRIEFYFVESDINLFIEAFDELQEIDWTLIESDHVIKTLNINNLIVNFIKYKDGNFSLVFPGTCLFYTESTLLEAVKNLRGEYSV